MNLWGERASRGERFFTVVSFVIELAACSNEASAPGGQELFDIGHARSPILGGSSVEAGEFSGVVWLDSGCTATLVHPKVIVFAAHCGLPSQGAWAADVLDLETDTEARTVEVQQHGNEQLLLANRCAVNPGASIGNGRDLAYCVLEKPALHLSPLPLIGDSERSSATVHQLATLVGFGFDSELEDPATVGTKRVTTAPIIRFGSELIIGDNSSGTCMGDSGGPALVARPTEGWSLLGVLSSGEIDRCGEGRYTDIHRFARWLEEETGMELDNEVTGRELTSEVQSESHNPGKIEVHSTSCGLITRGRERTFLRFATLFVLLGAVWRRRSSTPEVGDSSVSVSRQRSLDAATSAVAASAWQ